MLVYAAGCNQQTQPTGFQRDQVPPTVSIIKSSGDTLTVDQGVVFDVQAADNLGLQQVTVNLSGGFTGQLDTVFTSAVTSITLGAIFPLPQNTTAGGVILIDVTATDGNGNSVAATDSIFLFNTQALTVTVVRPNAGAVASRGLQIPVEILAAQTDGIRKIGYTVAGVATGGDSILIPTPLPDTVVFVDTFAVPATADTGNFTVTGFAEDSTGRRATSTPVTVNVQAVIQDTTAPIVTFTVPGRAEVRDSITVTATDPSGIATVGWAATELDGTPIRGDTTNAGGTLTDVRQTYVLDFNFTSSEFPKSVIISAFAIDAATPPNTGQARATASLTAPIVQDTIIVVNGITKGLPAGGTVADGIYNPNLNEFYLTNISLDRLEIFRVADTSFVTSGIPVGSKPWGLALWPGDTLGNNGDTVVVANSGGTSLSIVDVAARQERRRHLLPNFIVQTVATEIDPANNTVKVKVDEFDFSDRPQYVGMTCRPAGGVLCAADSIYAIYSTTPTIDQSDFPLRGSLRWENLTSATPQSHFFWEHAVRAPSPDLDTLQILADRGPFAIEDTVLSLAHGAMGLIADLVFQDSTFVRNSGNFTHALAGEGGGDLNFARAIGYNGNAALVQFIDTTVVEGVTIIGPTERDFGITPGVRVRDFIANTATPIRSIAINFNGLTNLIRADSVYVLNESLRLMGLISASGANPGMDFNFDHAFDAATGGTPTFGGSLNPNDRIVFVAESGPEIGVYDTFNYQRIFTIPIRDPVIGPLRVAKLQGGTEQMLIGVTQRGVVTVRLPVITNPFLTPPPSTP